MGSVLSGIQSQQGARIVIVEECEFGDIRREFVCRRPHGSLGVPRVRARRSLYNLECDISINAYCFIRR
jgi:hypothetical protein